MIQYQHRRPCKPDILQQNLSSFQRQEEVQASIRSLSGAFDEGTSDQGKQQFDQLMQNSNSYTGSSNTVNQSSGVPMYTAGECRGSVVNNRCMGTIIPKLGYQKKCYGPIVNGECKGAYY